MSTRTLDNNERAWAPLQADRELLAMHAGARSALYANTAGSQQRGATPLLLIHSINATASAIEMLPVFVRQARRRPVVALELPGFGAADRLDVAYRPETMQDAIATAIVWMQTHIAPGPVDVMALSLSCEFAVQVAMRDPHAIRTLSLISPTGIEEDRADERYEGGATRSIEAVRRLLRNEAIGKGLYAALTTRPSMRWFLSRAWGGADFDPRLLEHGLLCARSEGARHAPLDFVSGALCTRGIVERYRLSPVPLWVSHGARGAFNDFGACPTRTGGSLSAVSRRVVRTPFDTGAMPHFAKADAFNGAFENFLAATALSHRTWRVDPWPIQRHDVQQAVAVRAAL